MTTIYLVRHAHSTYTADELNRPLSDKGYKAAQEMADRLKHLNIDVVLSSPYKRAVETVQPFADHRNMTVHIDDGFIERQIAAEPIKDFQGGLYKLWHETDFSFAGGHSNKTAQKRGVQALENILHQYQGQSVMIGSHGNIMTLIMQFYDADYGYKFWCGLKMPDIYMMTFEGQKLLGISVC